MHFHYPQQCLVLSIWSINVCEIKGLMNGLIKVEFILHGVMLLRLDRHDGLYGITRMFWPTRFRNKGKWTTEGWSGEKGNYLVNFRRKMVGPRWRESLEVRQNTASWQMVVGMQLLDIIPYELKCLNSMGEPSETSAENTWAYWKNT